MTWEEYKEKEISTAKGKKFKEILSFIYDIMEEDHVKPFYVKMNPDKSIYKEEVIMPWEVNNKL